MKTLSAVVFITTIYLYLFIYKINISNKQIKYIYNKPNSGGLGNKLLGISSSLILSLLSNRQLICINNI